MTIGKSVNRVDAFAKVTGRAEYTEDFYRPDMLIAKYFRSTISHGYVKKIDIEKAENLEGVEAVFTYKDVPNIKFATAGHPFSLDPAYKDIEDKLLLTQNIRFMGDEIAVVVAENEIIANNALKLIKVFYEEFKPLLEPDDILGKQARQIHKGSSNILNEHSYECGGKIDEALKNSDYVTKGKYMTPMVHHCHIENHISYAYMDDLNRIIIVSSTQIPHIARGIIGQALDIPLSQIRVVKPFIGGGFGNKQDVILEPMVAFLTQKLDGRGVQINLSREECMIGTRNRHPFHIKVKTGFMKDGTITAIKTDAISVTGAYASHGHSVASAGGSKQSCLYPRAALKYNAKTIYANIPVAGAMRAYGSPQILYALESNIEDAALITGIDSVEFRLKNIIKKGDIDKLTNKEILSCGLSECLIKGRDLISWDKKKKEYKKFKTGDIRKGLGVACFSYASGVYPICVEIAGIRLVMNQDGTVHVQVGATEIGQGSDTVVAQMVSETLGLDFKNIFVVQTQDTDISPFDPGAYASRQAYVISNAVLKAAKLLKQRILNHAFLMTDNNSKEMDIIKNNIVLKENNKFVLSIKELALDSFYHKERGHQLSAEVSKKTTANPSVFGCTFVDITVDIPLCKIKINKIINLHDSGVILNPVQAEAQVHGGVSMGIGAALSEEVLIDSETGYIYNNNLLDYKMPTFTDVPKIDCHFVETFEPTSGYGNKALGEPPAITPSPAIRNAFLDATGLKINFLPMSPNKLFDLFRENGLL